MFSPSEFEKLGSRTCKPNSPGYDTATLLIESETARTVNDVNFGGDVTLIV